MQFSGRSVCHFQLNFQILLALACAALWWSLWFLLHGGDAIDVARRSCRCYWHRLVSQRAALGLQRNVCLQATALCDKARF